MRKLFLIIIILIYSCHTGNLKVVMDLPIELNEVSGIETDAKNKLIWMVNDSGNKSVLYGLDGEGSIKRSIKINAKNRDWEDLTIDPEGNIYIGNFGNNENDSKQLSIYKIHADSITSNQKSITPEIISFSYSEQKKFPPKRKKDTLIVKRFSISKTHYTCLLKVEIQKITEKPTFTNFLLRKVTTV